MFLAELMNTRLNRSAIKNNSTALSRALEKYNFRVKLEPVSSRNNVKFLIASSVEVKSKTKIKWLSSKSSSPVPFPILVNPRAVIVLSQSLTLVLVSRDVPASGTSLPRWISSLWTPNFWYEKGEWFKGVLRKKEFFTMHKVNLRMGSVPKTFFLMKQFWPAWIMKLLFRLSI